MKVQSNERPDKVQVMGDKTYLNLDIKDISYSDENSNGVSMFEYIQFKFPHPVSDEVLLKTEKEYKLRTIIVTTQNGNGNVALNGKQIHININKDDIEIIEYFKKLTPKQQQYYSHLIKADVLKEEMENETKDIIK